MKWGGESGEVGEERVVKWGRRESGEVGKEREW